MIYYIKKVITVLVITTALIFLSNCAFCINYPMLSGQIEISIKEGTITCDFELSDIPELKDYYIFINAGMNVREIKNGANNDNYFFKRVYIDSTKDESFGYYIPNSKNSGKYIPSALHFKYSGKYPVIDFVNDPVKHDWEGNIAFNGYSVRMDGIQAAWYPLLYDIKEGRLYDKVKCNIRISCSDCSSIYLNGQMPVSNNTGVFKNENPLSLMLYAGNFKYYEAEGSYFINPDFSKNEIEKLSTLTKEYQNFYAKNLKIPYKSSVAYIQTTSVSKNDNFLFIASPSIVNVGTGAEGFKGFFLDGTWAWFQTFLMGELGHYYFNNYKVFDSELKPIFSEGLSEFCSLKMIKEFFGEETYNKTIEDKTMLLYGFKPIEISKIKTKADYGNRKRYIYSYTPLIFLAIEKEIGSDKMWQWMIAMLESTDENTDYNFLLKTLESVVKSDSQFKFIKSQYFESNNSIENVKQVLSK